jgi:hypothetical protein
MPLPCPLTLMRCFKLFFLLGFLATLFLGASVIESCRNLWNADLVVFLPDQEDASANSACPVPTKRHSLRMLLAKRRSSVFTSPLASQSGLLRTDCYVSTLPLHAAAVNSFAALYQILGVYRC